MKLSLGLSLVVALWASSAAAQDARPFVPGGDQLKDCTPDEAQQKDTVRIKLSRSALLGRRSVHRVRKAQEDKAVAIPNPALDAGYHTSWDLALSQNKDTALSTDGDWSYVKIVLPKHWKFFNVGGVYDVIRIQSGTRNTSSMCGPVVVDDTNNEHTAKFKVVYTRSGLVTPYNIGIVIDSDDDATWSTPIFIDPKLKDHG